VAEKYCDHGLYGAFVATANLTINSATMTVTGLTSGRIGIGAEVSGTGIPAETYILSLGTGRGGAGSTTYTLSKNATATGTGVTVTGQYGCPSLDPAWGVAQEGDGTASGAATPATVSVDMTGWTFSTSSTVSVMGATSAITCTASATSSSETTAPNAQYNATLTTMIDNLVTAINWHGGTTVNIPSGWTGRKVRDTVWARRNGNSLELMTRSGSASWNGLTALAFTNVTGSSSQTWANGAGGAWGYVKNMNTACWPSSIAQNYYGLWVSTPQAGVLAAGDVVNMRSNKTMKLLNGNAGSTTMTLPNMGTYASPVVFKFDDSTIWSDGANPVFTVKMAANGQGFQASFGWNGSSYWAIEAPNDPDTGYYGLVMEGGDSANSGGNTVNGPMRYTGVHFKTVSAGATSTSGIVDSGNGSVAFVAKKCKWTLGCDIRLLSTNNNGNSGYHYLEDCVIDNGSYASANNGLLSLQSGCLEDVFLVRPKFVNFVVGSKLCYGWTTSYIAKRVLITDPSLGNVSGYGAKLATTSTGIVYSIPMADTLCVSGGAGRALILDNRLGFQEWNPTRVYPTLGAELPEGTKWSMRAHPTTISGRLDVYRPFRLLPVVKYNTLADGARTFTIPLAVKDGLSLTKATLWAEITYTDVNDNQVTLTSYDAGAGSLTTDTGNTWSQESGGQVYWDDGGLIYFNKKKIELSTPTGKNLKQNTDVKCVLCMAYTAGTVSDMVFFDPDIQIA
jgi:hypothetical protein